jgi:His/Glu/Gln/Arg/opine family amino acid ABC transporter permease subunit
VSDLWEVLANNFPEFATAWFVTVRLCLISFVIAMAAGVLVAALRISPLGPLRALGTLYVETFRNTPLLVLLIVAFAGLRRAGIPLDQWSAATASLGLYTGAYIAEAIRSGVFAVGKGQIEAGLSVGLSYRRTIRTVIPPIGNIAIAMIKNSAIIGGSIIALTDLMKFGRNLQNANAKTTATFFWVAVGYLLVTIPATYIVKALEKRLAIRR